MKIRKATKKDFKRIATIYEEEMFRQFKLIKEKPISAKKYVVILKNNLRKSKMFVLEDTKIKGFIWWLKENDEFNLEEIFITEKNRGYGKILMDFMKKQAKKEKIKKINLDVHFKNKKAQKFFEKMGFTKRTIEMSIDLK